MGRVIRHRNDYGAVLLCDARFAQRGTQASLSKWIRDHLQARWGLGGWVGLRGSGRVWWV